MKLQFDTHHAKIKLEIQGLYFTVNADRLHITSVIFNLLDNALKYSKEKPEIIIRLQQLADTIILEVEDKGIGIPPDFKGKVFDKFFRVPTGDHHNIKGYGLGLSYVAHVIKRHNGTISVESEAGKGSTFTVKFPVT
jgi:two-component system phosphate regulon sensor histidine kinase PhoR